MYLAWDIFSNDSLALTFWLLNLSQFFAKKTFTGHLVYTFKTNKQFLLIWALKIWSETELFLLP